MENGIMYSFTHTKWWRNLANGADLKVRPKGQDYEAVKRKIPRMINTIGTAPILLGVEFAFKRDPFRSQKAIDRWWDEVLQDYEKLKASQTWNDRPFMQEIMVMAFDATARAGKHRRVKDDLTRFREIRYCAPGALYKQYREI